MKPARGTARRVYGVLLRLAWDEARDRAVALLVVAVTFGVLTTVTALMLKLVVESQNSACHRRRGTSGWCNRIVKDT